MAPPSAGISRASASTCSRLSARNASSQSPTRSLEKVSPTNRSAACFSHRLPPFPMNPTLSAAPGYSQIAGYPMRGISRA